MASVYSRFLQAHVTSRGDRNNKYYRAALLASGVNDGRVFFSRRLAFPTGVFAVIPYKKDSRTLRPGYSIDLVLSTVGAGHGIDSASWAVATGMSYARLLQPVWGSRDWYREWVAMRFADGRLVSNRRRPRLPPRRVRPVDTLLPLLAPYPAERHARPHSGYPYDQYEPDALDDPSRDRAARASTLSLTSYSVALIGYRTASEIKKETDEAFSEAFPWLAQHRISLTKIRGMRMSLMAVWRSLNLELSSLALAIVYFEKLVWSHCVEKGNAAVLFGACCVLGHKFNEPQSDGGGEFVREHLLPRLASLLKVPAASILRHEFSVWTRLGFGLHVPLAEMLPHFERLLSDAALDVEQYLRLDAVVQPRAEQAEPAERSALGAGAAAAGDTGGTEQHRERSNSKASSSSSDLGWVYESGVHYDYGNDDKGAAAAGAAGLGHRPFYAPLPVSMGIDAISLGSSSSSSSSSDSEGAAREKEEVSSAQSVASSSRQPKRSPVDDEKHGRRHSKHRTGGIPASPVPQVLGGSLSEQTGFALARRSSTRKRGKPSRRRQKARQRRSADDGSS